MFGSKKDKKIKEKRIVTILDKEGIIIMSGELSDIEFTHELVVQKSIEFFDDPEPCYIHQGAVICRLQAEIDEMLLQADNQTINIENENVEVQNSPLRGYLGFYKNANQISCK